MRLADLDTPAEAAPPTPAAPARSGRDTSKYHVGGVRVPSVTEVIDLAGLAGIDSIPQRHLDNAAHRGSMVHLYSEAIDLDDQYDLDSIPDAYRGYCDAYIAFKDETGFEPRELEQVVVSKALGFAGTVDRFGLYRQSWAVVDLKATAAPYAYWPLQTVGYAIAIAETNDLALESIRRFCVQLKPNGRYVLHRHRDPIEDRDTFAAALRVAQFRLAKGLATLED